MKSENLKEKKNGMIVVTCLIDVIPEETRNILLNYLRIGVKDPEVDVISFAVHGLVEYALFLEIVAFIRFLG